MKRDALLRSVTVFRTEEQIRILEVVAAVVNHGLVKARVELRQFVKEPSASRDVRFLRHYGCPLGQFAASPALAQACACASVTFAGIGGAGGAGGVGGVGGVGAGGCGAGFGDGAGALEARAVMNAPLFGDPRPVAGSQPGVAGSPFDPTVMSLQSVARDA